MCRDSTHLPAYAHPQSTRTTQDTGGTMWVSRGFAGHDVRTTRRIGQPGCREPELLEVGLPRNRPTSNNPP